METELFQTHLSNNHLPKKITVLANEHPPTHILNTFSERILSSSLKMGSGTSSGLYMRIADRSASSWLLANVRGSHPEPVKRQYRNRESARGRKT
jgi:hypothetical protein